MSGFFRWGTNILAGISIASLVGCSDGSDIERELETRDREMAQRQAQQLSEREIYSQQFLDKIYAGFVAKQKELVGVDGENSDALIRSYIREQMKEQGVGPRRPYNEETHRELIAAAIHKELLNRHIGEMDSIQAVRSTRRVDDNLRRIHSHLRSWGTKHYEFHSSFDRIRFQAQHAEYLALSRKIAEMYPDRNPHRTAHQGFQSEVSAKYMMLK